MTRLDRALAYFWLYFAAGAAWLYLKAQSLQHSSGLLLLARQQGREPQDLAWWECLALFGNDALFCLLAVPLAMAALGLLLPRRLRGGLLLVLLWVYLLAMFANLMAMANVGRFLSLDMIGEALLWAHDDPAIISAYVTPSAAVKLALLLSVFGLGLGLLERWARRHPAVRLPRGAWALSLCFVGLSLSWGALAQASGLAGLPQSQSSLGRTVEELLPAPAGQLVADQSLAQLQERYCSFTHSNCARAGSQGLAKSPRSMDVLIFVLETAPQQFFDLPAAMARQPEAERLLRKSFVARAHYSTYPYTSDAMFSIFSSVYADGRRDMVKSERTAELGWVNLLRQSGYLARQYAPLSDSFESDMRMYKMLGFEQRYIAEADADGYAPALAGVRQAFARSFQQQPPAAAERRLALDYQAWLKLKADVLQWKHDRQHFVATFSPQIGHAPWLDMLGREGVGHAERAELLLRTQVAWLEELLQQLRKGGHLQDTLIVVTGDHGLRTRTEYERLPTAMLTGMTDHVPLLIYAGGQPLAMDREAVSSHVDIGPTVLTLLGREDSRPYVEGMSMTDPGLRERLTFMHGVGYVGAQSLHDHGSYFSHAPQLRYCLKAETDLLADARLTGFESCSLAFDGLREIHQAAFRQLRDQARAAAAAAINAAP